MQLFLGKLWRSLGLVTRDDLTRAEREVQEISRWMEELRQRVARLDETAAARGPQVRIHRTGPPPTP